MPGLYPNVRQDAAACGVLIAIYLASAIAHQVNFQVNRRRGHRFYMSWAMFGFGMARVATLVLRLAWACRPDHARLAIAAQIFTNVGILVIYVVDLLLALRVFRALHPRLGWKPILDKSIKLAYVALAVAICLVIGFVIASFYTLNPEVQTASLWATRSGILVLLLFNLIAPILYLLCLFMPPSPDAENFGKGSMKAKLVILGVALFFTLFIAGFRTGVSWSDARPLADPAWYDTRAAFYVIELGFEIIITCMFLFTRFEQRFWIPNGSKGPGDYSRVVVDEDGHQQSSKTEYSKADSVL